MSRTPREGRHEISAGQWQRLEVLLESARQLPSDARDAYLDDACAGDAVLRAELASLLAADEKSGPLDRALSRLTPHETDRGASAMPPGAVVSHYEIQQRLGSGGMGVVYRARDLRLGRTVALKFLPPALSGDARAKKRFLTEARAAAALEHSNVCAVHEIGETDDGQLFIAMAFIEGESLHDILERGTLPVAQALDIARQIGSGLDCAHRHGIVHRDVKPANMMVAADGVVKIVDFGVAKLADATITNAGATPGTLAYMSPEQARGEDVDHRTDLWALGVVLFEMLSGRRPFPGDTDAIVLQRITGATPPNVRTLRADIPTGVETIVSRALEKSRERRFQSAREFLDALDDGRFDSMGGTDDLRGGANRLRGRSRRLWVGAAAAVLLAIVAAFVWLRVPGRPAETLRVSISVPGAITPQLSAAISPDGREVAFVATNASGPAMLWVRSLDQLEARALPGTERAAHPFWSPDGRSIGFIADNQIKRVDLAGGAVRTLADSALRYGPAWEPDGTILFSRRFDELAAVPAAGGIVRTLLSLDPGTGQTSFMWPRFLSDGRRFIFFGGSDRPEKRGIYVGSLDSKQTKFILRSDFRAWYAPPGYLVYPRDEALVAQAFDETQLELRGEPTVIADGVWFARPAAQSSFSVSTTGVLAYVNATFWDAELAWYDRAGRPVGSLAGRVRHEGLTPQISPDGRRVAVGRGEFGRENIWVLGVSDGSAMPLTFGDQEVGGPPVWSADGRRVMYKLRGRVIVRDVARGTEETVADSVRGYLQDWSRDGQFVVYQRLDSHADLWALRLDGKRIPFAVTQTPFNETQAQLSPDGHWIAYTSNESGRDEVYVQTFPTPARKRQVSIDGGAMPRWRRDAKELFYLAANQFITAVPIVDSRLLEFGPPAPLFRTRLVVEGSESLGLPTRYDVAPNGRRFLLRYPPVDPGPPITIVINWTRALVK